MFLFKSTYGQSLDTCDPELLQYILIESLCGYSYCLTACFALNTTAGVILNKPMRKEVDEVSRFGCKVPKLTSMLSRETSITITF